MENPSNLLAASHVKDNGQWPRQGIRTLEKCNLVLKSVNLLLKIFSPQKCTMFCFGPAGWFSLRGVNFDRVLFVCWRLVRKFSNSSEEHVQDCDSQNQQNYSNQISRPLATIIIMAAMRTLMPGLTLVRPRGGTVGWPCSKGTTPSRDLHDPHEHLQEHHDDDTLLPRSS